MPSHSCPTDRDAALASGKGRQEDRRGGMGPFGGPALQVMYAGGIDDAFAVISAVRTNQSVLLNCSGLEERCGERLITICTGGIYALDGLVRRISTDVVLFAPALTRLQCS